MGVSKEKSMNTKVEISICIPAYNNDVFLKRLLNSISEQSFKNFEVIVTDDSPNQLVELVCNEFAGRFLLKYFKNEKALGSPANWNVAISKASGEWIKIMHHDDWFANAESLGKYHEAIHNDADFIFAAFIEIDEKTNQSKRDVLNNSNIDLLKKSPYNLFKKNFIGHPSTTLVRNHEGPWFNERFKWVVDFEFYIRRLLLNKNFVYINEPLIHIGISDQQVTKSAFRNPQVEIPENMHLLNLIGVKQLRNIFVYDYYWRLLRNLSVRNINDLAAYVDVSAIPRPVKSMLSFQSIWPLSLLKVGFISKPLMFISYLFNYLR